MKSNLSKSQALEKISSFFQKKEFTQEEMKKIKRLAMKFNIKLRPYKSKICKKCLSMLKGKIRISRTDKTIICEKCNYRNRFKLR